MGTDGMVGRKGGGEYEQMIRYSPKIINFYCLVFVCEYLFIILDYFTLNYSQSCTILSGVETKVRIAELFNLFFNKSFRTNKTY